MHLWEIDHRYYCKDSNYLSRDCVGEYDSFESFISDPLQEDFDLNLLFRWDWKVETEEDSDVPTERGERGYGTLKLYRMQQRKGHYFVTLVQVGPEDEEAVRDYLTRAWDYLLEIWEPIAPQPGP